MTPTTVCFNKYNENKNEIMSFNKMKKSFQYLLLQIQFSNAFLLIEKLV